MLMTDTCHSAKKKRAVVSKTVQANLNINVIFRNVLIQ